MRKVKIICLTVVMTVLLQSVSVSSQQPNTRTRRVENYWYCNYYGGGNVAESDSSENSRSNFVSVDEAKKIIERILKPAGLTIDFNVAEDNSPKVNAYAAVLSNGDQIIRYNKNFIQLVKLTTNTDWSAVSIMAHEIAHHLTGSSAKLRFRLLECQMNVLKDKNSALAKNQEPCKKDFFTQQERHASELLADKWSGFILNKLGATLAQSQIAMNALSSDVDSYTHPRRSKRLQAISEGWMMAKRNEDIKKQTDKDSENQSTEQKKDEKSQQDCLGLIGRIRDPNMEKKNDDYGVMTYERPICKRVGVQVICGVGFTNNGLPYKVGYFYDRFDGQKDATIDDRGKRLSMQLTDDCGLSVHEIVSVAEMRSIGMGTPTPTISFESKAHGMIYFVLSDFSPNATKISRFTLIYKLCRSCRIVQSEVYEKFDGSITDGGRIKFENIQIEK